MPTAIAKRKRDDNVDSLLKDEVEFPRLDTPFPRGGGSELAPLEIKRAAAEATNDVFEQMVKSKKQKRGKSKSTSKTVAPAIRIEPLTFNKIRIGSLILGSITDVKYNPSELVVSLPNNLIGYCPSSQLDRQQIGRYLRFAVTELGEAPKRRLVLSVEPDLVNQGIDNSELTSGLAVQGLVESVEEKGLLLDLGSSLGKGFLKLTTKELARYQEGEAVMAFVKDPERRIKSLTLEPNTSVAAVISQPSLVPGTLVKSAPVNKETPMGCVFDLLGHITATSDAVHSQGDSEAVRVLFSHPALQINGDRQLGVSRADHIVHLTHKVPEIDVGKVVAGTVSKVMPNLGLFINYENRAFTGFAHISQIKSDKSKDLDLEDDERYAVNTKHSTRIIGYSDIDGVAYVSLDEEVINQKYVSVEDIKIGDVVPKAIIDRILPKGGVLVRISKGLVGIAAEYQLSDVAMRNPELKYKVGQSVSARVLNVANGRIELSLKKSIVYFEGPILASYDTLNGRETVGTVVRVEDYGAKVLFFGGVRGLLPAGEMSETGAKPEEITKRGMTVRVHVLEADSSKDRLIVSTRSKSELVDHIGEVFEGQVLSRTRHETRVAISADLGEVTLVGSGLDANGRKLKVNESVRVKILTDHLATNDPTLLDFDLPADVDQLEVGQQLYGYVSGTVPDVGVFVAFAGGLVGLVPANVIGTSSWPEIGKTVKVTVDTVDFARKRVYLSLPSAARTINGKITAVKATQLNVVTDDGQSGRVDISQIFKSIDEIKDKKNPLSSFRTGQELKNLSIIGRHDARNHRFLPLTHRSGSKIVLELALNQGTDTPTGSKTLAFVNNYSDDGLTLWVTLTPSTRAQLSLVDLSNDEEVLKSPEQYYPIGSALEVTVLKRGPKMSVTALSSPSDLALVFSVHPLRLMVRLPYHKTGVVNCVDSSDDFQKLKKSFKAGTIVHFRKEEGSSHISLRSEPHEEVEAGQVRKGYVWNIADGGIFVALAPNKIGRVQIGQISDSYLKNWRTHLRIGDVVEAKVLSVSGDSGKIELSLKPSVVTGRKQPNIDKVELGRSYNGVVCRVETFGVFVNFKGVSGLCHKSEISDHAIDDLSRVFKVGDSVRVKVLSKDVGTGRVSLGMKAKYFEDDDDDLSDGSASNSERLEDSDNSEEESGSEGEEDSDEEVEVDNFEAFDEDDEDEEEEEEDQASSDDDVPMDSEGDSSAASDRDADADSGAALSAGFNWSGDLPDIGSKESDSDSEDSDSDADEPRQKRRRKREEFVRDETASLQTRLPQSAKDFERLIVSSPASSILWMNYMAFQLQLGEIDGAREIARRALKSIPQREEEERLNVWVALLNLEAQFGSPESTEKTFREAQQYMDSLTVHMRMATVFAQAGKIREATDIYRRAHKRFGGESMEPWLEEMRFFFTTGNNKTTARSLADQAIQRLPAREHRNFTRQFALMEFELGDKERGRTLFEALLASAPKRVDLWNVYIDQEIKHGRDEAKIAALFDRALQQRISMKQAKFFFKKWIDVTSDQEYVKLRAREYVENREAAGKEDNEPSSAEGSSDESESE